MQRLGASPLWWFRGPSLGATASANTSCVYVALDEQAARDALVQLKAAAAERAAALERSAAQRHEQQAAGLEQMHAREAGRSKGGGPSHPAVSNTKSAISSRAWAAANGSRAERYAAQLDQHRRERAAAASKVAREKAVDAARRDERRQMRAAGGAD